MTTPAEDLTKTLDALTTSAGSSTAVNRVLRPTVPAPAIPARVGTVVSGAAKTS